MHRLIYFLLSLACFSALAQQDAKPLFDGQSLTGWQGAAEHWKVEGGAIVGEIPAGIDLKENQWLAWKDPVHDFELSLDYRITGSALTNSGIQIRSQIDEKGRASGLQCDLDDGKQWLGRIYDEHGRGLLLERGRRVSISPEGKRWEDPFAEAASLQSVAKAGEWNSYRIRAVGSHVEVWVNGVFFGALDDHEEKAAEWNGRLAFQLHSGPGPGKVEFRNILLTNLGKTEMPPKRAAAAIQGGSEGLPVKDAAGRVLNLDFESGDLRDWTSEGDAWDSQPIKGDTVPTRKQGQSSRHAGSHWIGGYEPLLADTGTGMLTSVAFPASQPWASFLIGGSTEVAAVRVEVLVAATGKVFHTAGGRGVEDMHREVVDLGPVLGQEIKIRLVDKHTGHWGHLNFDDFVFHKTAPEKLASQTSRVAQSPVLWHLRENLGKSSPVTNAAAQRTVKQMQLPHGFQADLVAAEPDVRQPIAFCMDEKGRLWVLEGHSYPNKQPEGQGRDRVVVFEDKDGDGHFESRSVFVEGLNLASGIEVGFGGVYIGAAPHLLHYADNDGDLKADAAPEVLLDGWGWQDTHETLNSFVWGPDGWLYGCHGVFTISKVGRPGMPKDARQELRAGVWRFHPLRKEFEVFCHGGSNQWGLDYDAAGQFFMTHCRSFHGGGGTTHVIRNGHYWNQANRFFPEFICNEAPDFAPQLKSFLPAAALYDSGEGGAGKPGSTAVFGGHSHVGTLIYQETNWPAAYRGHLFTHNLHGHQINHQLLVRQGSGYEVMHAGADLAYTPDPRYMGVDLQAGPDGAVYTIDWYDQQHCHTPIEEKWDRTNGRIYRISWAQDWKPVKVDLAREEDRELVALQKGPSEWYRRHARRLLMERAGRGRLVEEGRLAIEALAKSEVPAEAVRGLWLLEQCHLLKPEHVTSAAKHVSEIVRFWAVQLAMPEAQPVLRELALTEESAFVRMAIASALPRLPKEETWALLPHLTKHTGDANDRFLPKMLWYGLATVCEQNWPQAFKVAEASPLREIEENLWWYAAKSPQGRDALVAYATSQKTDKQKRMVSILAYALKDQQGLAAPQGYTALAESCRAANASLEGALDQLGAVFGEPVVLERMKSLLMNSQEQMGKRKRAAEILRASGSAISAPALRELLRVNALKHEALLLAGRSADPAVAEVLVELEPGLDAEQKQAVLATLTSHKAFAKVLVSAMAGGKFDKGKLTALHLRQMKNLKDAELDALLEKNWGRISDFAAGSQQSIAKFKELYKEAPLWAFDAKKGQEVFQKVCGTCHTYGGKPGEGKVGPDLAGTGKNGIDYFLENVIDPNAVIGDAFQLTLVTKKDGGVVAGILEGEAAGQLKLRTLTVTLTVPAAEVKTKERLAQSLMPPGLLEALPEREALELLKFLCSP